MDQKCYCWKCQESNVPPNLLVRVHVNNIRNEQSHQIAANYILQCDYKNLQYLSKITKNGEN